MNPTPSQRFSQNINIILRFPVLYCFEDYAQNINLQITEIPRASCRRLVFLIFHLRGPGVYSQCLPTQRSAIVSQLIGFSPRLGNWPQWHMSLPQHSERCHQKLKHHSSCCNVFVYSIQIARESISVLCVGVSVWFCLSVSWRTAVVLSEMCTHIHTHSALLIMIISCLKDNGMTERVAITFLWLWLS